MYPVTSPCACARSNCFRARYSRRSIVPGSPVAPSTTSTCRIRGIVPSAVSPSHSVHTGTSRQPSTTSPAIRDTAPAAPLRASLPPAPSACPRPATAFRQSQDSRPAPANSRGIAVITPTPSLVLPSAAVAPRCASLLSAVSAFSRMSCEAQASTDATNPTPHES